jgi:hypothetical protein
MRFQEADTLDDLAKISQDQDESKKANHWLSLALSMVPKEYILIPEKGQKDGLEVGEAYWLILGKTHLQKGLWVLKAITKGLPSRRRYKGIAKNVVKHFTLTAYYFKCFCLDTSTYNTRINSLAYQTLQTGLSTQEIRSCVRDVATRYNIDVSEFFNVFNIKSVKTSTSGESHEEY